IELAGGQSGSRKIAKIAVPDLNVTTAQDDSKLTPRRHNGRIEINRKSVSDVAQGAQRQTRRQDETTACRNASGCAALRRHTFSLERSDPIVLRLLKSQNPCLVYRIERLSTLFGVGDFVGAASG